MGIPEYGLIGGLNSGHLAADHLLRLCDAKAQTCILSLQRAHTMDADRQAVTELLPALLFLQSGDAGGRWRAGAGLRPAAGGAPLGWGLHGRQGGNAAWRAEVLRRVPGFGLKDRDCQRLGARRPAGSQLAPGRRGDRGRELSASGCGLAVWMRRSREHSESAAPGQGL